MIKSITRGQQKENLLIKINCYFVSYVFKH